jgi:hypothetical protein
MDKQDKLEVKHTPESFAKKFEELVKETGFTIVPSLTWVLRDDSTWSTKVNLTVGQIPTEEKK